MRRRRVDIERDPPGDVAQGKSRRGTGNRTPNDADLVALEARRKRRREVFSLKMAGGSTTDIATQLEITPRQVQRDFRRACFEIGVEETTNARALANAQLDATLLRLNLAAQGLTTEANKGVTRAVHALANVSRSITKIVEAKARLNGSNVVQKQIHEHHHEVQGALGVVFASMSDERYAQLVEEGRELDRIAQGGGNVRRLPPRTR